MLNFVSVLSLQFVSHCQVVFIHITFLSFFNLCVFTHSVPSSPLLFLTLKKPLDIHRFFFNGILMITETLTHIYFSVTYTPFFLSLLQILQVLLQLFSYLDSLCLWSFLEDQLLHYLHQYMASYSPVMQYMQQTGCEQKTISVLSLLPCLEE